MDEVTYVDAGLNLADGRGWTSSAWPWETDREFYSDNSPLYPAALFLWVKVCGISMVSARAYCYFLAAVGMTLLWVGTMRFNLLTSAYRLAWIIFLSTEYAMNWMERNERYDVWIFVGLTLAWFGASLRNPLLKYPIIFLGCFLVPFAGFIGVTYIFLAAGLATILTRFKSWKEAFTAMAGASLGVIGVGVFFFMFGRLHAFQAALNHLTVTEQRKFNSLLKIFIYPSDDWGVSVMIVLLVALSLYYWNYPAKNANPWLGLGWGMIILMPCIMLLRGVFVMMYFYMLVIPLSLAILQLTELTLRHERGRYLALAITAVMAALCFGGLPARLYVSWTNWDFRNPQLMREFIRSNIHPDDAVYSAYPFYFELRDYVKYVATTQYRAIIPPDEARQINVVLVEDSDMPDLSHDASSLLGIGGGWIKVAVFPTAKMMSTLKHSTQYETFTLYRRDRFSP